MENNIPAEHLSMIDIPSNSSGILLAGSAAVVAPSVSLAPLRPIHSPQTNARFHRTVPLNLKERSETKPSVADPVETVVRCVRPHSSLTTKAIHPQAGDRGKPKLLRCNPDEYGCVILPDLSGQKHCVRNTRVASQYQHHGDSYCSIISSKRCPRPFPRLFQSRRS